MKSEVCVFPDECVECGACYDVSFDFSTVSRGSGEELVESNREREALCWVCR